MTQLLGFALILALIAVGLAATGAEGVLAALPFELMLIGGAALGTLLLGNAPRVARDALAGFWIALRGSRWQREDHARLLAVLHELCRRARMGGPVAIEADIEDPQSSTLLASAPRLMNDRAALSVLCDAFRLAGMDLSGSPRIEAQMTAAIERHVEARMQPVAALHSVADALPALGIVAAVLGIIKTMTAIDSSSIVLGSLIASALLGTFLGVFLSYGLVGPVANRFGQVVDEEAVALDCIRVFLAAHFAGAAPGVCLELARAGLDDRQRPATDDLDRAVEAVRFSQGRRAA